MLRPRARAAVVVAMALGGLGGAAWQAPQALASAEGGAMALAPTISSFTPTSGPAGTVVTVNGAEFAGSGTACTGTTVTFHGVKAAACTFVSSAKLKATVPLPASTGRITVKTSAGSVTSAQAFTVTPSVKPSPSTGPPTTTVTVAGGGFGAFETVDVYFDTTDEALAATNANGYFAGITMKVPASAVPGAHWVTAEGRHSGLSAQHPFTVATSWDQFGRVPRHTHVNPFENVLSPGNVSGMDEAWRYTTDTGSIGVSSPAVANGVVYIGSGGNVNALNASTGARLWSYATGIDMSSPAVANGVVYIGSTDGSVYALNASTGTRLWSYATGNSVHSSPAVANGVVYIGSSDGSVYAFNASTGARLWSYATGSYVLSSPAVAKGVVYVGSEDNNVYALNAATGVKLWSYATGASVSSSPAVANGVVYVGSQDNSVYALNASTGAKLWSYATGNSVASSPAVANGVVYVGSWNGGIYALSASTGEQLWHYGTGLAVTSSPAVAHGVVYVGSGDGSVYALNAATGARLWSYLTGSNVWSSPAVVNGVVYIGSFDRNVYAFELAAEQQVPSRPARSDLHPNHSLHIQR